MIFNTQSDKRWANDDMGKKGDPLRLWGCLVTCLANIYNLLPGELNEALRIRKGYNGLTDHIEIGKESNIEWPVAEHVLGFKRVDNCQGEIVQNKKVFYIARILHRKYKTGHYCNVTKQINGKFEIFDTDFGDLKLYDRKDITKIIRIERL